MLIYWQPNYKHVAALLRDTLELVQNMSAETSCAGRASVLIPSAGTHPDTCPWPVSTNMTSMRCSKICACPFILHELFYQKSNQQNPEQLKTETTVPTHKLTCCHAVKYLLINSAENPFKC